MHRRSIVWIYFAKFTLTRRDMSLVSSIFEPHSRGRIQWQSPNEWIKIQVLSEQYRGVFGATDDSTPNIALIFLLQGIWALVNGWSRVDIWSHPLCVFIWQGPIQPEAWWCIVSEISPGYFGHYEVKKHIRKWKRGCRASSWMQSCWWAMPPSRIVRMGISPRVAVFARCRISSC